MVTVDSILSCVYSTCTRGRNLLTVIFYLNQRKRRTSSYDVILYFTKTNMAA